MSSHGYPHACRHVSSPNRAGRPRRIGPNHASPRRRKELIYYITSNKRPPHADIRNAFSTIPTIRQIQEAERCFLPDADGADICFAKSNRIAETGIDRVLLFINPELLGMRVTIQGLVSCADGPETVAPRVRNKKRDIEFREGVQ